MPFQIREALRPGETRPLQVDWVVLGTWTLGLCLATAALLGTDFEAEARAHGEPQVIAPD
jgi:hypothetical protein